MSLSPIDAGGKQSYELALRKFPLHSVRKHLSLEKPSPVALWLRLLLVHQMCISEQACQTGQH